MYEVVRSVGQQGQRWASSSWEGMGVVEVTFVDGHAQMGRAKTRHSGLVRLSSLLV